jgi:hypothetical protein
MPAVLPTSPSAAASTTPPERRTSASAATSFLYANVISRILLESYPRKLLPLWRFKTAVF